MNIKKVIILISISLISVVVLFIGYNKLMNPFFSCDFNPASIISDCASCRGTCYAKIAYEKNDLSICESINKKENDLRNYCFFAIASKRKDPKICDNASVTLRGGDIYNKNDFIDSCLFNIGVSNNDGDICDLMNSESNRENCYAHLGAQIKDASLCYKVIKNIEAKNHCLEVAKK